jgi:hypothetical protein
MADRLLVASYLWSRGLKADYLAHDLWAGLGAHHHHHHHGGGGPGGGGGGVAHVELSVEEATRVCQALGVPFLVVVKAHVLREKQAVKLRAVRDPSVADATVPLQQLARAIVDRLPFVGAHAYHGHHHAHHHHHHGASRGAGGLHGGDTALLLPTGIMSPLDAGARLMGGHHQHHHHHAQAPHHASAGVEVSLTCLDRGGGGATGSEKRKVRRKGGTWGVLIDDRWLSAHTNSK